MAAPAIKAEGLSKRYHIGSEVRHDTLRDSIAHWAGEPLRRLRSFGRSSHRQEDTIWALKDVSFQVERGKVLGVIGPNGAGKSTLLKVLSKITEPTEGRAVINGRVASLLEVGTGFHPELTGWENIYLSGALLGMKRAEISEKFDEIVEFSGVGRFIYTPLKRYSSGMKVRLGFAVAAYLDPEILLIDEVLAVGDAEFQKKCMGKMDDVAGSGRTVLFVSHNMASVQNLCHEVVWVESGRIRLAGVARDVVAAYQEDSEASKDHEHGLPLVGDKGYITLTNLEMDLTSNGESGDYTLEVSVEALLERVFRNMGLGVEIRTTRGILVSKLGPAVTNCVASLQPGRHRLRLACPCINRYLAAGKYVVGVWLSRQGTDVLLRIDRAGSFMLPVSDSYGSGHCFELSRHGVVPLPVEWRVHHYQ